MQMFILSWILHQFKIFFQITDELLTDTDAALAKALDSIEFGEKVLDDAKDTLDTLKGKFYFTP